MKIEKKTLGGAIEKIIGEGVINGEEVDITTKKVISAIWPIIEHLKDQSKIDQLIEDYERRKEVVNELLKDPNNSEIERNRLKIKKGTFNTFLSELKQ